MPNFARFADYQPSPRDDQPWLGLRLLESTTPNGAGAQIDQYQFASDGRVTPSGLDTDPRNPQARSFTTSNAALTTGWYTVVFYDGDGLEEPTEPIFKGGPVTPSVHQVAQLLRARTIVNGGEVGTFTTHTSPTAEQVEAYTQTAVAEVVATIGRVVPPGVQDLVRQATAIGTAMLIEVGSEDVNEVRFDRLKTMYDERMTHLQATVSAWHTGRRPAA